MHGWSSRGSVLGVFPTVFHSCCRGELKPGDFVVLMEGFLDESFVLLSVRVSMQCDCNSQAL